MTMPLYEYYRLAHEHAAEGKRGRPDHVRDLRDRRAAYAVLLGDIHGRYGRPLLNRESFQRQLQKTAG